MTAFIPLLVAAGAATGGALYATFEAIRRWMQANREAAKHKVVLEVDGKRIELTGQSPLEVERAIHDRLAPTSSTPNA